MQYPAVAVIIVSYNSLAELCCCLEALDRQTVPVTQIIVVDNNSIESSQEVISCQFPHVNLLRLKKNYGFAKANNIGLTLVDGCSWVALLNPDAYPAVDWLEKMLQAIVIFPEYAFFGSRMLLAGSPDILDGVGDCYHMTGLAWRRGHGCVAAGNFMESCEIFSPCAAAALYRLDILTEVGG
ncbi:glycosyltransferase family 2 protein, partial [bacterium]|nr:glycosyltransferase family 2 protein [bacterium]